MIGWHLEGTEGDEGLDGGLIRIQPLDGQLQLQLMLDELD